MSKATVKTSNKTTAISTKQANKKIENAEKLTKEEVAQLQQTAQDRQLEFCDSFKKATEKRKDITVTKVSSKNNITIRTASAVAEICRKEKFTAIYTCRCTDTKERDKLLKSFKDTELLKTCKTKKYLDSKETRIELILESNTVDKKYLDLIVETVEQLKAQRNELKKAK
jgi:predicted transcriptional regulator